MEIKSGTIIADSTTINYKNNLFNSQFNFGDYNLNPSMAYWLYEKTSAVGSAVGLLSWIFSQIEPVLLDKNTNTIIIDHPFLELLNNPGKANTKNDLFFNLMKSFCLTSETYPILIGNTSFEPVELKTEDTYKFELYDKNDELINEIVLTKGHFQRQYNLQIDLKRKTYTYQTNDKLSETIPIINEKRRYGIRGLSPLDKVYYECLQKYYGSKHNTALLKNSSNPGGIWQPESPLSEENFKAFKKDIEDNFIGVNNVARNIITPRPIKYQDTFLNPKDMNFIQLIENAKIEIYNQYHIPLPIAITSTMTMDNYKTAILVLYDLSLLPRANYIFKGLSNFCLPRYKNSENLELIIDEKKIPALMNRLFERVLTMSKTFIYSDDEMRSITSYEPLKNNVGNEVWKPLNLVQSGQRDDYTDDQIDRE